MKYTPDGRPRHRARGAPSASGGVLVVDIVDTGVGIPPADLPRITERFYRVDKARSRELGGTGLGLAIVKHLVIAHGGELTIDSTLGQGTTVRFTLPTSPPSGAKLPAGARTEEVVRPCEGKADRARRIAILLRVADVERDLDVDVVGGGQVEEHPGAGLRQAHASASPCGQSRQPSKGSRAARSPIRSAA